MCMIAGKDELLGPKINGNPERFEHHILIRHECAEQLTNTSRDLDSLAAYLHARPYEGIVWHHPDGRMAKLKKRTSRPEPPYRPRGCVVVVMAD